MAQKVFIPPALAEVSKGRDHIHTNEAARATGYAKQTVRKHHCLFGHFMGIKPVKVGKRLLWPVEEIARLLTGECK